MYYLHFVPISFIFLFYLFLFLDAELWIMYVIAILKSKRVNKLSNFIIILDNGFTALDSNNLVGVANKLSSQRQGFQFTL